MIHMDINELFQKKLAEGCSLGPAQWIYARHHLDGDGAPKDLDIAEEWFDLAWRNRFPGTANTQRFLLQRKWPRFVNSACDSQPRLRDILLGADLSASEEVAHITLHPHNDAQAAWLGKHVEEIADSFRAFGDNPFSDINITIQ